MAGEDIERPDTAGLCNKSISAELSHDTDSSQQASSLSWIVAQPHHPKSHQTLHCAPSQFLFLGLHEYATLVRNAGCSGACPSNGMPA